MVVLKCDDFFCEIVWNTPKGLWKTRRESCKKCRETGGGLAKNALKTEMHRLVAMHLRIG